MTGHIQLQAITNYLVIGPQRVNSSGFLKIQDFFAKPETTIKLERMSEPVKQQINFRLNAFTGN
jgi:hypothetical protein